MGDLIVTERPELRSPRLVVAFGGWPDAASVGTRAVVALQEKLQASRFAEILGEEFYSPFAARPTTVIREGRVESLHYPENAFYYWRNPSEPRDLIFLAGLEPHFHWHRYIGALLDLAQDQAVTAIYALGGLYDNVPHTRPVRVSAVAEDEALRQTLGELGAVFSDYEGPSSLHTSLLVGSRARRIPVASLWGHAPAYAQLAWSPTVTLALVAMLNRALGIDLDLDELRTAAGYLSEALDKLSVQNPQIRALIHKLEKSYGPAETQRSTEPLPISENILREVEEILRRHGSGEGGADGGAAPGDGGDSGER